MSQLIGLKRSEHGPERPVWTSAAEAEAAWSASIGATMAVTTQRRYRLEVARFLRAWDDLPWVLERHDLWRYVDLFGQGCRSYRRRIGLKMGDACLKGQDVSGCNSECLAYESMRFATVDAHLGAVSHFFRFMEQNGMVEVNHVESVKKAWVRQNKHRNRTQPRRVPSLEDVRKLYRSSQANRAALYAVLAKTGTRIAEALSLRLDAEHFKPGHWLLIPEGYGKRRGNRFLPIDRELARVLEAYLPWREARMTRFNESHSALFVTPLGRPLAPGSDPAHAINRMLRGDQERLGLLDSRGRNFTAHAFRHFFSDALKRNGCDDYWWHILRGDVPRHNQDVYIHPTEQDLIRAYHAHAPRLGVA